MTKRNNPFSLTRIGSLIAVLLVLFPTAARAVDVQFYQSNDILYYLPGAASQCKPGSSAGSSVGGSISGPSGNKDYKGRDVIPEEQMKKIQKFQPIYEKAEAETGVPWQIFAVLHIRESVLADFNPDNGQGVYQDFERAGGPYPPGKVTDEELLRQTIYAGKIVEEKSEDKFDLVKSGDPDAIKFMFFGYNGRAAGYVAQAVKLGFSEEEARNGEGSPYVMNIADEKRDPEVAGGDGTWGQVKRDLGPIEYPANGDYGAYVMYAALAGVPATTGGCVGAGSIDPRVGANGWSVTGPNAMVVYYQDEEPWASKPFGGTIRACGCGPTSVAMAVATLNKDSKVTPEVMANFFVDNGYLNAGCGSNFAGLEYNESALATEFGLSFAHLGTDLGLATEAIKRGSFVFLSMAAGSGPGGAFGGPAGHIMLIRGITASGNFLLADPNKSWGVEGMSDKTMNEEGFPPSMFQSGIQVMYEIRKK